MEILFYVFAFFFGLTVGSFLNSIIYRFQTGAPHQLLFKSGGGLSRSFCPYCKHQLSWQDLIPIFSFLILRGKCRYCGKKISLQYPLVELATAFLFLLIFLTSINVWTGVYLLVILCFLIIIFVYDLKHYLIPDKIIYPTIGIAFLYQIIIHNSQFILQYLISAFGAAVFFLTIVLISRGKWMGAGDIKLAFFIGLFLGWPNILVALFLAFFIGAIIGIGLIASHKKSLRSEVPFGPFLVAGTLIALFWGQSIINWYLNFFNGL